MATGKDIIKIASKEIGYHEEKNKHNKYGEWYGLDCQPWCMEFVQYCYAKAGIPLPYKTASCGALLNWYRKNQPECITKNPVEGCIVIFDFPRTKYATDHTGIFVSRTNTAVTTIDGNTSGLSQDNGGWVQQKTRNLSYANPTYIVPIELTEGEEEMDIAELIRKMTPEQADEIVRKAEAFAGNRAMPINWDASEQLADAMKNGITDGARPMAYATRLEAALMANRAAKSAIKEFGGK